MNGLAYLYVEILRSNLKVPDINSGYTLIKRLFALVYYTERLYKAGC